MPLNIAERNMRKFKMWLKTLVEKQDMNKLKLKR